MRAIIRARRDVGLLPTTHPERTWAGPGLDKPCDACDSIIAHDTEFEVDFVDQTLRMHAGCHIVWKQERDCP